MVGAGAGGLKHTTVCLEPSAIAAAAAVTATAAVAAVGAADTPGGGG